VSAPFCVKVLWDFAWLDKIALNFNRESARIYSGQQDVVHVTRLFFATKSAKAAKLLNFLVFLASWWLSNIILTITESARIFTNLERLVQVREDWWLISSTNHGKF